MIMYFGRSKCEASAENGVVLHQPGYSKGFNVAVYRKFQADNSVLSSALKGFAWTLFGSRFHSIYIYIYMCDNVFLALIFYVHIFWTF